MDNFFNIIRGLMFGNHSRYSERYPPPENDQQYPNQQHPPQDEDNDAFGIRVFSNPVEMHQYFERQLNEVLKAFGMVSTDDGFFGQSEFPAIEGGTPSQSPRSGNLRDQYLKPGYEHPSARDKSDETIDGAGTIDMGELDVIMKEGPSKQPQHNQMSPRFKGVFSGQSFSSKTVRNADGSVEVQTTKKDHEGNEEVSVTRKWGDKEYTVTTRTDKTGKQETLENIVNMDEADLERFRNKPSRNPFNNPGAPQMPLDNPENRSIFDKYFVPK